MVHVIKSCKLVHLLDFSVTMYWDLEILNEELMNKKHICLIVTSYKVFISCAASTTGIIFLAFFRQVKLVQGGYEESVSCSTLGLYWPFARLKKKKMKYNVYRQSFASAINLFLSKCAQNWSKFKENSKFYKTWKLKHFTMKGYNWNCHDWNEDNPIIGN